MLQKDNSFSLVAANTNERKICCTGYAARAQAKLRFQIGMIAEY
jgi:hypothetical protein